jgi:glycosyltransferase involved in cell wall biosynthesis
MTNKENPLVSVIVRTKDRPGLLRTALGSIALQDYRPVEVILINDGGCDLDINAVKIISNNCSLNYIHFEKSKGRAAAGNAGISAAKGKYISFLDDDDEFLPDHCSTLVASLEGSEYKVAYADTELVSKVVDPEIGQTEIKERKVFASYDFSYKDLVVENYIPLISILFFTDIVKEVGGFDNTFDLYEDWDLLLRVGWGYPFHHIKKVTSMYNQWNKGLQIGQAAEPHIIQIASAQIFRKHQHKITPDVILNFKQKQEIITAELKALNKKYTLMESELSERDSELLRQKDTELRQKDTELRQKDTELRQKDTELRQKDTELRQKDTELYQTASQLADKALEVERLSNANMHLSNAIAEIQSTLGWHFLTRVRDTRDKLLPQETMRGKIYQKIINRLKGGRFES